MRIFQLDSLPVAWRLHLATFAAMIGLVALGSVAYVIEADRIIAARIGTLRAVAESAREQRAHHGFELVVVETFVGSLTLIICSCEQL